MIIDFNVNFNKYIEQILNFYGFWNYICPSCNAKNSFTRHATYLRNICVLNFGVFEEQKFIVLRLYCNSCKITHAVLPAETIPYCFYSFQCVFTILCQYFIEEYSIPVVSDKFNVSNQMIYLFVLRYIECAASCVSFLRAYLGVAVEYNSDNSHLLSIINNNFTNLTFLKEYFIHTNKIFLMTRSRNILSKPIFIGMWISSFCSPTQPLNIFMVSISVKYFTGGWWIWMIRICKN